MVLKKTVNRKYNKMNKLNINLKNEVFKFLPVETIFRNIFPVSRDFSKAIKCTKLFKYLKKLSSRPIVIPAHSHYVYCIVQLDDNLIASCSHDKTIRIFEIFTANCIRTIKDDNPICAIEKLNENELIAGNRNGKIKIWNFDTGSLIKTLTGHTGWINQITKVQNTKIISYSQDRKIKVFDTRSAECLQTIDQYPYWIYAILLIDENHLISASSDKTMKLWQINNEENTSIKTFNNNYTNFVYCLAKIDEQFFWSAGSDQAIRKWNIYLGECLEVICCSFPVRSILPLNSNQIIVAGWEGQMKKFNTSTGALIKTFSCHETHVRKMISIRGLILLSCSNDKSLIIQKI